MAKEYLSGAEQGYIMMLIQAFLERKEKKRSDYDDSVADTLKKLYNRLNKDGTFRFNKND